MERYTDEHRWEHRFTQIECHADLCGWEHRYFIMDKFLYKELSYKLVGCFYNIRNNYGPGQKESVYHNLLSEELDTLGLFYEKEKSIKIYSSKTNKVVGYYKPDCVIEGKIIIEIKSSRVTTQQDEKQLYHYLRNSGYEVGYLVNFSTREIYIKRIIYSNNRKPFLIKSA